MLIYLDANIVQYCADYGDFLFGPDAPCPSRKLGFRRELLALRELIFLEQFGNWEFAAPEHLLVELHRGRPTGEQRQTYAILEESSNHEDLDKPLFDEVFTELSGFSRRHRADRIHLATAAAMHASWFVTNDKGIIRRTPGWVRSTRVVKPSQCVPEIGIGLFLS